MSAEQPGDFLYVVAAVDFDTAVIEVTLSHDRYPPPLALRSWIIAALSRGYLAKC
jgi:hypothetical protein